MARQETGAELPEISFALVLRKGLFFLTFIWHMGTADEDSVLLWKVQGHLVIICSQRSHSVALTATDTWEIFNSAIAAVTLDPSQFHPANGQ